ncbi:MAG: hypothetical protein OWU33_09770 [Firmicutes bacterium]|nr:hypothetical protein [Bacillota bacterium]
MEFPRWGTPVIAGLVLMVGAASVWATRPWQGPAFQTHLPRAAAQLRHQDHEAKSADPVWRGRVIAPQEILARGVTVWTWPAGNPAAWHMASVSPSGTFAIHTNKEEDRSEPLDVEAIAPGWGGSPVIALDLTARPRTIQLDLQRQQLMARAWLQVTVKHPSSRAIVRAVPVGPAATRSHCPVPVLQTSSRWVSVPVGCLYTVNVVIGGRVRLAAVVGAPVAKHFRLTLTDPFTDQLPRPQTRRRMTRSQGLHFGSSPRTIKEKPR